MHWLHVTSSTFKSIQTSAVSVAEMAPTQCNYPGNVRQTGRTSDIEQFSHQSTPKSRRETSSTTHSQCLTLCFDHHIRRPVLTMLFSLLTATPVPISSRRTGQGRAGIIRQPRRIWKSAGFVGRLTPSLPSVVMDPSISTRQPEA